MPEPLETERRNKMSETTQKFIVNGDGTVTDTSTGLMWQQETQGPMNWESAINCCESLTLAGHDDWRLPNINELQSIIDYSYYNPVIDYTVFPDTTSSYYWASDILDCHPDYAWRAYFGSGHVYDSHKSNFYYVRAVRGGRKI